MLPLTLALSWDLCCAFLGSRWHKDLGIRVHLLPTGSVRFEAAGAEQVGIVTSLLEGGVLGFIPLRGLKF